MDLIFLWGPDDPDGINRGWWAYLADQMMWRGNMTVSKISMQGIFPETPQ